MQKPCCGRKEKGGTKRAETAGREARCRMTRSDSEEFLGGQAEISLGPSEKGGSLPGTEKQRAELTRCITDSQL